MNNKEESYYFGLMDFATLIREFGAKSVVDDLKESYPEIYNQIVIQLSMKQERQRAKLLGG